MAIYSRAAFVAFAPVFAVSSMALAEERSTILVTAQRDPEAVLQATPGGVDSIDHAEFADRVAVSLRDALAFSPGVYTQPRFGQEVRLSIRGSGISRGFHMRGLTLLQDGIPINLADDNGDFQEFDPQIFERIDVYRGANALRLGGSTLGGAINAVTPTGRTAPGFELRLDGGSFSTIRGKAAAGFSTARGDAYLALTGDSSDGDRQHAQRHAVRLNGNAGLRLSDTVETRFHATISHIRQDLPGTLLLSEALTTPKLSRSSNIISDQERDIDSIRLQNRTTVALGSGTLAFGLFYNIKQLFHPIFQVIDQNSRDRGVFASLDVAGDVGGLPWEATLGTQARFGTVAARQYLNVGGRRGALTADARQTARTINSYGELRVKPLPAVTIVAGGLYTSGEREVDNHLLPSRGGKADFGAFSPKFGILLEPAKTVQIYANYSRSAELPGYAEIIQTVNTLPTFIDVSPQKAWTLELGTRGSFGIASWDISLYRADLRGEMLQFSSGSNVPASTFNADRTRHQGIEAGLDLRLAPWARLRQVYMLNDFRFRNDASYVDNRLPVIPQHQYRAELRIGTDALNVTPNIEWTPKGAWADYVNGVRAPGYALIGLGARAEVRKGVSLFLDARNITNKKAVGDISAVVAANGATVAFYPVERRAFHGGIRANF